MINKLLDRLSKDYKLNEIEVGEFSNFKAKGMEFVISAYKAEGLGHISVMKAKGFFGLMKMDTVIIVPFNKDLPLYSYDRIYVMKNDTLIVELYNTMINNADFSKLDEVKNEYANLTERDPGVHWYDPIKLPQSISKKAKKVNSNELDELTIKHFEKYLNTKVETIDDLEQKNKLSSQYVLGLLKHGGPSTDVFIKLFGEEKTTELYKKILFGIN